MARPVFWNSANVQRQRRIRRRRRLCAALLPTWLTTTWHTAQLNATYPRFAIFMQISRGFGDIFASSFPRLQYVLRGVKRLQGSHSKRQRLPITPDILRELHRHWSPQTRQFYVIMLWAACCMGFFGFLRAGEFTVDSLQCFDPDTHLTPRDVSVDSRVRPSLISLLIKQSKTDPFRRGTVIYMGRTDNVLCPVAAVLSYLARRGDHPGPLFLFEDGSPLSRSRLVSEHRKALSSIGLNCDVYAGQFSHWGCHHCCIQRARGFHNQVVGSLAK